MLLREEENFRKVIESLSECRISDIYHITMVKGGRIAEILGVPEGTIVCMKNGRTV